jgi:hypothetical protein
MKSINITLNIQTLKPEDEIVLEVAGCYVYYNKQHYIISVHQGLPIKSIIINNKIYTDFIICAWCDLMIINIDYLPDLFVFKHFVKKQIEPADKYFINDNKFKFINNEFMPIGMIPNNPIIMYNCLETDSVKNIIAGQPIYNKNKLAGIVSKIDVEDNYIYVIPTNYILNALNKRDNKSIYYLNEDINNIEKINYHKVVCGKIYCSLHKMYIPIESYVIINSEINYSLLLKNGRVKDTQLIIIDNHNYNNNLIIKDKNITFTSGFMNYLKIVGEVELLKDLLMRFQDLSISQSNNLPLYTYQID